MSELLRFDSLIVLKIGSHLHYFGEVGGGGGEGGGGGGVPKNA